MAKSGSGTTPNQQGSELIFGKYKNLEEASRGYNELVNEASKRSQQTSNLEQQLNASKAATAAYEKLIDQMKQGSWQPSAPVPEPSLTDLDGDITPDSLRGYLDARLRPIQDSIQNIPASVESATTTALERLLAPVQTANNARMSFFNRPEVDGQFESEMDRFLSRNPGINKSFQILAQNPETAEQAHEMAYKIWKSEKPTGEAINRDDKVAASGLPDVPGNIMTLPGDNTSKQGLMEMGIQSSQNPDGRAKVDFMKQYLKGTKLEKSIEQMKNYASSMGIDVE